MSSENNIKPIDAFVNKQCTFYSAIYLPNGSEKLEFAYERSLKDLSKKLGTNINILKSSLKISRKLYSKGITEWGLYDNKYSTIIIESHDFTDVSYDDAKQKYFKYMKHITSN